MAARTAKKAKKAKRATRAVKLEMFRPPERVIGEMRIGESPKIDRDELAAFIEDLRKIGIDDPCIRFVARNAPFMRRAPIPPV
jgi:hypothetical protein